MSDWRARALCLGDDPTMWDEQTPEAVLTCHRCPTRAECLADSMRPVAQGGAPYGMRGGLAEAERMHPERVVHHDKRKAGAKMPKEAMMREHELRLAAHREGLTDRQAATRLGMGLRAFRGWRQRQNLPPNAAPSTTAADAAERRAEIARMVKQRITRERIAERLGISTRTVQRYIHELARGAA